MDFSPYQQKERFSNPNANYTDPLRVHADHSGGLALAKQDAKNVGVFINGVLAYKEKVDSAKSMEANNEYNRLMSEGTAELMQRKQEKALNIVDEYDKLQAKVLERVQKQYKSYIGYGDAAVAFNNYTTKDNATRRANMLKYQLAETDAFHETQFNNQMADCAQMVGDGGYSDEAIAAGVNRALPLVESRYANYGSAMIQQQMQAAKRGMVENALSFFSSVGNYSRVKDICQKYRDVISPGKMSSMLALVGKRQEEAKELALQQRMWSDLGPNATPSQVEAWADNYLSQARRSGNQEGIPLYKQWDEDWASVPFSNGTLGTSGCAPTSLAMELSWFLGEYISPVEVANYATGEGLVDSDGVHGSKFIPAVAKHYGVEMRQTDDKKEVIDLLRRGVPVVAAHDPGMFTDSGHFLVYTGIDADGRVMINDPNGGVRHSDDATFSLDEIFNQESADYYVPDNLQDIARRQNEGFNNVEIDEVKANEIKKKLLADYKRREGIVKTDENYWIEQGSLQQQDLINQNVEDPDAFDAIALQCWEASGHSERVRIALEKQGGHLRNILRKAAEREAARASGTGGRASSEGGSGGRSGKKNSDPFFLSNLELLLRNGCSREQAFAIIDEENPSDGKSAIKLVNDYFAGKEKYAVKWSQYEGAVAEYCDVKKDDGDFDVLYGQATNYAYELMMQYRDEHGGKDPTSQQILEYLIDGVTKTRIDTGERSWFGFGEPIYEESPLTPAEWLNRGVYNDPAEHYDSERGVYTVQTRKGTYYATEEQYERIVAGEDADIVLAEQQEE